MRVALKLVLATVLGTLAVLIIFGWVRAQHELALFDSDMRKDHSLIGLTLATCVADVWETAGPERAVQLIKQADAERPNMVMGFVDASGRQSPLAPGISVQRGVSERMDHFVTAETQQVGPEFLVTRVPVRSVEGKLLGAVEIAESLAGREEFVSSNIISTL